jgi:hypothetical protein
MQVPSYLSMIVVPPGQNPPPLDVLRWWFTMNYDAVEADKQRQAFALRGQGVRVLCENEMLGKQGERIHTGQAEDWNRQFAANFTKHFAALAAKYPIYAELQNIFDLAMIATLIKREHLDDRAGWHATCFGRPNEFPISLEAAPKTVQTVINHRVVNRVNILAAVSGGVTAYPGEHLQAVTRSDSGQLNYQHERQQPKQVESRQWWWD